MEIQWPKKMSTKFKFLSFDKQTFKVILSLGSHNTIYAYKFEKND